MNEYLNINLLFLFSYIYESFFYLINTYELFHYNNQIYSLIFLIILKNKIKNYHYKSMKPI